MERNLKIKNPLLIFGLPVLLMAVMAIITRSAAFGLRPEGISLGITIDLLLIMPLLYLLSIRRTRIPKTTVVPVLIAGMVVCSVILPRENQQYLTLFKEWALPVVELSILAYVILSVRRAIRGFASNRATSFDFFTALKNAAAEILPKRLAVPFATEIAVFYYGFLHWGKRKPGKGEFTYHRESGTVPLLYAIIFIVAIETVVLHKLLLGWHAVAAWAVSLLSVYSGIQIFGFLRSMPKRLIRLREERLFLPYGIMSETEIDLRAIDSVELTSRELEKTDLTRKLSVLGDLESHNVVIRLREPHTLTGLYGRRRTYQNLALYVDDKVSFKNMIDCQLQSCNEIIS